MDGVGDLGEQARDAAGVVEVGHVGDAGGLEVDEDGHAAAELVELGKVEAAAEAAGDGGEVDDAVGRAAERMQDREAVAERRRGEEVGDGRAAGLGERDGAAAGRLGEADPLGRGGGRRAGHGQGEAHRLDEAGHRARRAHHRAGADRGDQAVTDLGDLACVDLAGAEAAPDPAAVGAGAEALAAVAAGVHRAGGEHDRRDVAGGGGHDLRRHGLVAAADRMTASIGWARISSSVSIAIRLRRYIEVGEAKLSWIEIVGKTIGRAAGEHHAALRRLDQLRDVAVAGIVVGIGVGDADDRAVEGIVESPWP